MTEKNEIEISNPLGTEKIGKLIFSFGVPSVISQVVNALYNIVDQIFIGQGVGYLGNGATSVIMPITVLVMALALLMDQGAASYLSLKLGEGDKKSAAKGVGNAITILFLIGIVLTVLFNIFLEPLCLLFGATPDNMPYALEYGRIICCGVLFFTLDSGMSGLIRADGSPKYSMVGLLVGCITNIILDPIFIFVFHWGVKGAALATVIGQILNAIVCVSYIGKFKSVKLDASCFALDGRMLLRICSMGTSSFITQISIVIVMAVSNNVLVHYGSQSIYGADIPLTTLGIVMKVNMIVTAFVMGLSTGVQPIFGYNYGSNQRERVKQTFRIVLTVSTIFLIFAFLIFQFTPMSIVRLFGSESDLYNEFAVKCFRIYLLVIPLNGLQMVTRILFQSIGKAMQATVLSLARQIVFLVIPTILLPMVMGVEGALWASPLAEILAFLMALVMLKKYWKTI
ncbi:MAG: MATE family efflux transporter [bacterium]|nr:MATE family efflux transporter [bacterium]